MPLINNNKIKVKIKQIKHNMKNYLNIRNDIKKIHMKIITYFNIYNKYMNIKIILTKP